MNKEVNILLRNGKIPLGQNGRNELPTNVLATIGMNLSYYGFALNRSAFEQLRHLESVEDWWTNIEPELKRITGEDRNIGDFVVYKNFPKEVLEMSQSEYWTKQILMYWGLPNEIFTQKEEDRGLIGLDEKLKSSLKVFDLADENSLKVIYNNLLNSPKKWTKEQFEDIEYLSISNETDFSKLSFKENFVKLATIFVEKGFDVKIRSATDVLRLGAGLSDGDVSLREKSKFRQFSRQERRYLLGLLEKTSNLDEDISRRPEVWKRFLHGLHVSDYASKFAKTFGAASRLYSGEMVPSFNSLVEQGLENKDENVLSLLASRPGEFRRRLVHAIDIFNEKASNAFIGVIPKLDTIQLVSLRKHLETVNKRETRIFPPKGNWSKLQISEARHINGDLAASIGEAIGKELKNRLSDFSIGHMDNDADFVKLQTNDADLSPYGRGTVFPIPENINFIRTASYWEKKGRYANIWFDNGWNFFDKYWKNKGTLCWNATKFPGAVFSGDPTNSKEMKGRACQLIDLQLDGLAKAGVRYAVWNILCFSNISFNDADDVFAALQWGEDAQKGKLFEPSRCQLSFPIHGDNMTKYIAYIDVEKRQLIYMDANLPGYVNSAASNGSKLQEIMPAFVEYLGSLPSVYDLFRDAMGNGTDQVLYSDKDTKLDGERAYVFKPENPSNKFEAIEINKILSK